jgi:hypothetical protein
MIESIVAQPEVQFSTFLQWRADDAGRLTLVREPQLLCPQCETYCGHLFHDQDTPEGACLSCKIDGDVIARREAEEDERAGGEGACCLCGID